MRSRCAPFESCTHEGPVWLRPTRTPRLSRSRFARQTPSVARGSSARWLIALFGLVACARRVEPAGVELALPAKGPNVRFVAVGDTGDPGASQASVASAMAATCAARGCDFALLLGDNLYPSGPDGPDDPALERAITRPFAALGVPVLAVIGNHDDGGSGWSPERGDAEIAWTAKPSWWKAPSRHYRASIGDLDVIVLDTDAILFGRDAVQRTDVARWLASSTARWKLVAGHHPYASNGKHGDAGRYDGVPAIVPVASGRRLKRFLEEVVCGKANAYFSAHDHQREWMIETCAGTELIVSGAGASPRPLVSRRQTRFASEALGFFYGDASRDALVGDFVDASAHTDFSRTLTPR